MIRFRYAVDFLATGKIIYCANKASNTYSFSYTYAPQQHNVNQSSELNIYNFGCVCVPILSIEIRTMAVYGSVLCMSITQ